MSRHLGAAFVVALNAATATALYVGVQKLMGIPVSSDTILGICLGCVVAVRVVPKTKR
ncbi:hypothetical protein [Paracoccus litorisediminis]|uniref:Uncharacterized protein n=1 Tax=Paracoccus litorisediminis TaxID=2006130 RepID=A0A844HSC2_9RHOB|nr:hypothetical protein [Paracoccus litorisediminis]MTH61105.1 hypothetical protein [Paracoccus litorisediminis]